MKEASLISIIIPTYNRAHLISETLDSIIDQTYQNWECIIVDDGSTDHTAKVVEDYCNGDRRFQYHHRPKDRLPGGNAARNYGFELSKGEYVNWFDSDDIMLPDFLNKKIKLFNCHPNLDAVLAYGAYFENKNIINVDVKKPKLDLENVFLDYVSSELFFITHGPLWKRSFLIKQELFDEKRLKIQDTEFHFRMLLKGLCFMFYSDSYLFLIRRGDDRVSAKATLSIKKLEDVLKYHFFTLKNVNRIPDKSRLSYQKITAKKTLQSFYELVVLQKEINIRIQLRKKHSYKLNYAISVLSSNNLQTYKLNLAVLTTVIFKKGFSFFK